MDRKRKSQRNSDYYSKLAKNKYAKSTSEDSTGEGSISGRPGALMDIMNFTQSNMSADEYVHNEAADNEADVGEGASGSTEGPADQLNEPITPTEEGWSMLDRICEAVSLAGKELSEDERLHITNFGILGECADYAGVMRTMGLPAIHHSTWDKLVSCLGTHVERLSEWSCEQVKADINRQGDHNSIK